MLQILKTIECKIIDDLKAQLSITSGIQSDINMSDFIEYPSFIAYLQNFSRVDKLEHIDTSPLMGIKNKNYSVTSLEISY